MEYLLLALRLLSAALLLGFLGLMAWLIYQDLRLTAVALEHQHRPQGHLRVVSSEKESLAVETLFPLLPITSIGRSTNSTIVLDDGYVSGEHALIIQRGRQWWVEDLGSRNGTLLNDMPLTEAAVVSAGDIITIGNIQLKIEF